MFSGLSGKHEDNCSASATLECCNQHLQGRVVRWRIINLDRRQGTWNWQTAMSVQTQRGPVAVQAMPITTQYLKLNKCARLFFITVQQIFVMNKEDDNRLTVDMPTQDTVWLIRLFACKRQKWKCWNVRLLPEKHPWRWAVLWKSTPRS